MTTRQEITTLVILPVNPDPRSNGIQCYLSLVGQLSSLPGVAYTSGQGCNDSGKAYYNSTWHGCYIAEILLMQDKSLFGALQFVILPDHIDGLACQVYDYLRCEAGDVIQYINLVLAPLYVFGDNNSRPIETMYDNRDSFIFFNKHFLPPDYHLLDIYQEPNLGYLHNVIPVLDAGLNEYPHPVPKTLAIYAGKGHYAVDHSISGEISDIKDYLDSRGIGFSLITRSWPESKQAYLQLIADSIGLIMLDPFTNVLRDALLLGVPVFSAVDGIDYQCYGVSRVASSFINSLSQRRNIREYALSRQFGLARFNLLKQSLF